MKRPYAIGIALVIFGSLFCSGQNPETPATDCKCCSAAHRAFDFWVGSWEVTLSDGRLAGTNRIEKLQDGCVLQEHWKGAGGSTGTSLNFYNSATAQWEQLWVDNSGTSLKLKGNRIGQRMVLTSEPFTDAENRERIHRISWTPLPDGRVRQVWELMESAQVVQVLFEGYYRKVR